MIEFDEYMALKGQKVDMAVSFETDQLKSQKAEAVELSRFKQGVERCTVQRFGYVWHLSCRKPFYLMLDIRSVADKHPSCKGQKPHTFC